MFELLFVCLGGAVLSCLIVLFQGWLVDKWDYLRWFRDSEGKVYYWFVVLDIVLVSCFSMWLLSNVFKY